MRRTDEQFINEVYLRRDKNKKKQKQRNTLLAFLVPVLVFSSFLLPAMLPAKASDKSANPMSAVTDAPNMWQKPSDTSTTYPPGTVIIHVSDFGSSTNTFDIVNDEALNLIEEITDEENSYSSSADIETNPSENASDSKSRTLTGEKICTINYFSGANAPKHDYNLTFFEKGILDEDTGSWYGMTSEKVEELKSLLNLN